MARKIKRLYERLDSPEIDQLIQLDSKEWRKELAWWRTIGVDSWMLIFILKHTRIDRSRYEAQLQDRDRVTRESTRKIRRLRKAWKNAAPLIHLLKTEKAPSDSDSPGLLFGDLGELVDHAVGSYLDEPPPMVPRGRPGEPWLARCTFLFARLLMSGPFPEPRSRPRVRVSEKSTIRAIERVLKLAGHGEVVTKDKIRHVIRRTRRAFRSDREGRVGIVPLGAAEHRSRPHPDFTQELPRKLLPTRAKEPQSRRVASRSSPRPTDR